MDQIFAEITYPALTWTYNKLVAPSFENIQNLKAQYGADVIRNNLLVATNDAIFCLKNHLADDEIFEVTSFLGPEEQIHAQHELYACGSLHCSLCHVPYVTKVDYITSTSSELISIIFGLCMLVAICYVTYRVGSWFLKFYGY